MGEAPIDIIVTSRRSSTIGALAGALAKAQGAMEGAAKGNVNPHFKSKYADLASVWDACRDPLSKNGLAILQPVKADGAKVTVTTLLVHSSGEWVEESLTMTAAQNTPQGVGSAITYGRRYGLASMVGIAPEDDDGNAASARPANVQQEQAAPSAPAGYDDWLTDMKAVAQEGSAKLQDAWKKSKYEYRQFTGKNVTEALKRTAADADAKQAVPA